MQEHLTDRSKRILEAIIEDHIATAEPVGSRTISRRHELSLSPATVRNVMADLEELGYLASPHTSAGRVPTEKAYRFYVDSLLEIRDIAAEEQEEISKTCSLAGRDMGEVLRETSRMLSAMSHYMGIVVAPRFAANIFRHIEFIKLSGRTILAILVSQNGAVQNRVIETEKELQEEDLVRMSNYLNRLLRGLTITEVREKILNEMEREKVKYDLLLSQALVLSSQALPDSSSEIFIGGQANIMEQPEFADVERMRGIFRAFEEKGVILSLLDRCISGQGINIYIGSESHLSQIAGMSVITATYRSGRDTVGVLGVIGPTRMGYGKVIPIVDYTAKLVSRILEMK